MERGEGQRQQALCSPRCSLSAAGRRPAHCIQALTAGGHGAAGAAHGSQQVGGSSDGRGGGVSNDVRRRRGWHQVAGARRRFHGGVGGIQQAAAAQQVGGACREEVGGGGLTLHACMHHADRRQGSAALGQPTRGRRSRVGEGGVAGKPAGEWAAGGMLWQPRRPRRCGARRRQQTVHAAGQVPSWSIGASMRTHASAHFARAGAAARAAARRAKAQPSVNLAARVVARANSTGECRRCQPLHGKGEAEHTREGSHWIGAQSRGG